MILTDKKKEEIVFIHNYLSDVFTVYGRDCNAQTTSMNF